ncbi:MAG: phage terminase small subunit P27 family [Patescibacteria group bacterium]|nr:phage terminase small subunit P27 family [Patescibacteria group bacterium]
MTRGRPADPSRANRGTGNRPAQGTPRVRASSAVMPVATPLPIHSQFPPPPGLPVQVHPVWQAAVEDLGGANHMRKSFIPALKAYCEAVVLHELASEELHTKGLWVIGASGAPVANPMVRVQKDAAAMMLRYADSLGLTPAGRIRIGLMQVVGASVLGSINAALDKKGTK